MALVVRGIVSVLQQAVEGIWSKGLVSASAGLCSRHSSKRVVVGAAVR